MFDEQPIAQNPVPSPQAPVPHRSGFPVRTILTIVGIIVALGVLGAVGYIGYKKFSSTNQVTPTPQPINVQIPDDEGTLLTTPEPVTRDDTDGDGLKDDEEKTLGTSVTAVDTDGDGLSDFDEARLYKTDPLKTDTDNDNYSDGAEVKNGYNPAGEGKLLNLELGKQQLEQQP